VGLEVGVEGAAALAAAAAAAAAGAQESAGAALFFGLGGLTSKFKPNFSFNFQQLQKNNSHCFLPSQILAAFTIK